MKKDIKKILAVVLTLTMTTIISGCSKKNYGPEYNYQTDCQYSYYGSSITWKKIQSDGIGQYILKNNFIYYYNPKTNTMTPLCNKPNCLHDMETDKDRLSDCNAYARVSIGNKFIQYYDGYIYYFSGSDDNDLFSTTLYRVSKDGGKKDKIFTTDDEMSVYSWLIHRGCLYYEIQTHYYGENKSTQVYDKSILKSLELSSNMSEKNAKVIFESDEDHSVLGLYQLKAYKNYLCYYINANVKDFDAPDSESWYSQLYSPMYLYNIETEQNSEIPVPKGYSNTTYISNVVFLQDKMLFRLYDNLQDHVYDNLEDNKQNGTYKFPIYSINYDLTDEKIWLDNVEQGKWVQTYNDYVILSDASLQYSAYLYTAAASDGDLPFSLDDLPKSCNIEIYSADAKRVSYFVYPMNVSGNFNGFGPDGVNVEFADNGDSWSVYELNFDDVLNCHGEEVKLNLISTRKFGALNKEDN